VQNIWYIINEFTYNCKNCQKLIKLVFFAQNCRFESYLIIEVWGVIMFLLKLDDNLLIDKYSSMIYRIAYQYMKNKADAEDVIQDVFLKVIEKQPSFESEEHCKAWLIRTTANRCKDKLRSLWWRKTSSLDELNHCSSEFIPDELEELLLLPPKYRIVIHLYYYERYTLKEIAQILKINQNTVSTRLQRARQKLKLLIEEGEKIE